MQCIFKGNGPRYPKSLMNILCHAHIHNYFKKKTWCISQISHNVVYWTPYIHTFFHYFFLWFSIFPPRFCLAASPDSHYINCPALECQESGFRSLPIVMLICISDSLKQWACDGNNYYCVIFTPHPTNLNWYKTLHLVAKDPRHPNQANVMPQPTPLHAHRFGGSVL